MKFEFDASKSLLNKQKHGIDFVKTQTLWRGPFIEFAAKSDFESRFAILGVIDGKLHTCIYTLRNDVIRIISCRRARENERKLYEQSLKKTKKR